MRFKIKSSHVGHRNRLQHSEESCLTLVSSLGLVTNSHQRAAACSNKPPRTSQRHPSVCVGVFQCPLGQTVQQLIPARGQLHARISQAPSNLAEASKCLCRCFPMSSWSNDAATNSRQRAAACSNKPPRTSQRHP